MEQMEPAAFGSLRLSVDEFEAMTPREFNMRLKAEIEREDRERERLAQLACWVMNPWLTRDVTPNQLLGRRRLTDAGE